jgi:cbb3-type cytochrome oxidase maturation protein
MSIIYILIPIAILLTSLGIYLFFWAVKTEQFEDLEKQGMSILFDDEPQVKTIETELELKKEEEIQNAKNSTDNK